MKTKTIQEINRERRYRLWRMHGCAHPGCDSYAITACGGWVNDDAGGYECRRPVCRRHLSRSTADLDLCECCAPPAAAPTSSILGLQIDLFGEGGDAKGP